MMMRPAVLLLMAVVLLPGCRRAERMDWIVVDATGRGFAGAPSGRAFIPWGVNYDHDEHGRLLEDYWAADWPKVVEDFGEIRALGANVVRIHLQVGRFMNGPTEPNSPALARLEQLVRLAERNGLYLDLTGLGCYLKSDVPPWYDALGEAERWEVQARFWEAVAVRCEASPAIFCYDLMNEPVVPGAARAPGDWLAPPFAEKYHYVQFITLDPAGRPRAEIARAWLERLSQAIRLHDRRHLITVGLIPDPPPRPGQLSGFEPDVIAPAVDFFSIHVYPDGQRMDDALALVRAFAGFGKPVVIEELFPLRCSVEQLADFLRTAGPHAAGCLSFYWGKPLNECAQSGELGEAVLAAWLRVFLGEPSPRAAP